MVENFHNLPMTKRFPELFLRSGLLLATLLYEYKNTERALECLRVLKYHSSKFKKWNMKKKIYMKMSEVASLMGKGKLALVYAQKSLEMAWSLNDIKWEMLSYDMLGKCYYNLCKLEQAVYFHKRVISIFIFYSVFFIFHYHSYISLWLAIVNPQKAKFEEFPLKI